MAVLLHNSPETAWAAKNSNQSLLCSPQEAFIGHVFHPEHHKTHPSFITSRESMTDILTEKNIQIQHFLLVRLMPDWNSGLLTSLLILWRVFSTSPGTTLAEAKARLKISGPSPAIAVAAAGTCHSVSAVADVTATMVSPSTTMMNSPKRSSKYECCAGTSLNAT